MSVKSWTLATVRLETSFSQYLLYSWLYMLVHLFFNQSRKSFRFRKEVYEIYLFSAAPFRKFPWNLVGSGDREADPTHRSHLRSGLPSLSPEVELLVLCSSINLSLTEATFISHVITTFRFRSFFYRQLHLVFSIKLSLSDSRLLSNLSRPQFSKWNLRNLKFRSFRPIIFFSHTCTPPSIKNISAHGSPLIKGFPL